MTGATFANRVLGGASGLFGLAAVYGTVRHGLGGLALSCLGAALLTGLALRLEESRRIGAALAVLSSFGALWASDGFLASRSTVETRDDRRVEAARAAGVVADPRSMLEVVRDLRRTGVDAWPTVYIGNHWKQRSLFRDTLYPLSSISGVTSVMCGETSYVSYTSDELGFTNPPGQWRMASAELALVGDSYVMGWCVPPDESFASTIRARHPATIVLGHGASGPLTQLAQIREFLPALRPRHVLWFYYEENDLADLTQESGHPILARYLEPAFTQRLAERQSEVDRRLRMLVAERESLAVRRASAEATEPLGGGSVRNTWSILTLAHLRERITGVRSTPPPERPCCNLALLRRIVPAMQAAIAGWGGDLAMVYLPSERHIAGRPTGPGEQAGDSVVATVAALGVPVLDLRSPLSRLGTSRDLYAYEEAHFSVRGHQAVAALVLDFLRGRDSLGSAAVPPTSGMVR